MKSQKRNHLSTHTLTLTHTSVISVHETNPTKCILMLLLLLLQFFLLQWHETPVCSLFRRYLFICLIHCAIFVHVGSCIFLPVITDCSACFLFLPKRRNKIRRKKISHIQTFRKSSNISASYNCFTFSFCHHLCPGPIKYIVLREHYAINFITSFP